MVFEKTINIQNMEPEKDFQHPAPCTHSCGEGETCLGDKFVKPCVCPPQSVQETWEEEHEKLWTIGGIGIQAKFGHFSSAKKIEEEFIRHWISKTVFQALRTRDEEVRRLVENLLEEYRYLDFPDSLVRKLDLLAKLGTPAGEK